MVTHNSKIEIKKPLNDPRFEDKEASWIPSIHIEIEKPLGHPHIQIEIEKPLNSPQIQIEIEKPLSHPRFQDSFQVYQLSSRFINYQNNKTLVLCSQILGSRVGNL